MTPRELADSVIGTCNDAPYDELRAMTPEQCDEFDALVFCCEQCSWWCDVAELNDDYLCDDCFNDDD